MKGASHQFAGVRSISILACLVIATAAHAQGDPEPAADGDERRFELSILGGVGGFTGGLASVTDFGPVWGLQLDAEIVRPLYLELSYQGFVFPITDTRLIQQSVWGHGAIALAKISVPYTKSISPFVATGLSATLADPTDGTQDLFRPDVLIEIPAAIGLEFRTDFIEAGVRLTWRAMLRQALVDESQYGPLKGGTLVGNLAIGIRL